METEKTPPKDTSGGRGRTALVVVGVLGAIAVNIAAFMLSAAAITAVAEAAGISKTIAWALVLAVDGLMLTGTVVFIVNKLLGRSVVYPATVLASGVLLSIWCNALHAKAGGGHVIQLSGHTKMGVSAIPAVSLALSFHLIADMVKNSLGIEKTAKDEASPGRPFERLSEVSFERPPAPSPSVSPAPAQTLPKTPSQTPEKTVTKTVDARPKMPRQTAQKTPTATAKDTRTEARKLLKENPDMPAAEVARRLKKKPSGYMRTMCADILQELRDAGEIPSVRAVGA